MPIQLVQQVGMPGIIRNLDSQLLFVPGSVLLGLQGIYSGEEFDTLVDELFVFLFPLPTISIGKFLSCAYCIRDRGSSFLIT